MPIPKDMTAAVVEYRCDKNPGRLFTKLRTTGERPVILEGNLWEFSCRECARDERRTDLSVVRVLHRFDILGTLVESEVVR
jgi:hypothetical protein